MTSVPLLYHVAMRAARGSAPLFSFGGSKLARGIRGRGRALEALGDWGTRERDPSRSTVWCHAPSVGEGLQAGAVIDALRVRRPELQVAFTHFSPSAEGFGERLGADVSTYLPWDIPEAARRALDAVRPELLAFTKTEVWPVLVEEAVGRGVPVVMVAASVREGSGRMQWPARSALRSTWERLALVCADTEEDAERLVSLGVPPGAVHVTGDPGLDSAAERAAAADPDAPHLAPLRAAGRPVLVAGSTWPADERVLLLAWQGVRAAVPDTLLVVAPHEPTPTHLRALTDALRNAGLTTLTLAEVERGGAVDGADVVVVDRVGVLAHLYTVATVAYVGGGFGRAGLHSVLEPAAAGAPVAFGPHHRHARSAAALIEAGAARSVRDAADLGAVLSAWLTHQEAKNGAANGALGYIGAHRGAAERTAKLLEPFMEETGLA